MAEPDPATAAPDPATAPRPAATLVVVRDGRAGLEVLLTRRPRHMRFMGGMTVFPGGAVAEADRADAWEGAAGLDRAGAASLFDSSDGTEVLAAAVCALREAHEEVGFSLGPRIDRIGRAAADDPGGFLRRCLEAGAELGADRLVPLERWLTPLGYPLRFDTWFFMAPAPPGWEPDPEPGEVSAAWWASPAAALRELEAGQARMAPPTIAVLQRLARFVSVEAARRGMGRVEGNVGVTMAQRLSEQVTVVLAPNPDVMTGPGTNTYVVGSEPSVVIDPAVEDDDYLGVLVAAAGEVACIVVTHRHPDHTGGVRAVAEASGAEMRAFGPEPAGEVPVVPLRDGDELSAGRARLRVLHAPGHASDHICLLLEDSGELFAGDNVVGQGTVVIDPPDGDMAAYMASLERLLEARPRRIYPGHFQPLEDPETVLRGYLDHRREREHKILAAVAQGAADLATIVSTAYDDTPGELHPLAARSALAHLEKLDREGHVQRVGESWFPRG